MNIRREVKIILKFLFLGADIFGRTKNEQEIDELKMELEETKELLWETTLGLAWAAGDLQPPRPCSPNCGVLHDGPRAHAAIKAALAAETWNPPRVDIRPPLT